MDLVTNSNQSMPTHCVIIAARENSNFILTGSCNRNVMYTFMATMILLSTCIFDSQYYITQYKTQRLVRSDEIMCLVVDGGYRKCIF